MTELTSVQSLPIPDGAIPSKGGYLMPPWRKGQSGNPRGTTSDGKGTKAHALASALQDELMRSGGMEALAKRWVALAKKGNSTALAAILDRLYPTEQRQGGAQVVRLGVRLELGPGDHAVELAALQGPAAALRASAATGVTAGEPPTEPLQIEAVQKEPPTASPSEQEASSLGCSE